MERTHTTPLGRELRAVAQMLESDANEIVGLCETVYATEDAETGEDTTEQVWERAIADHKRSVKYLIELADRLPEFILIPMKKG